MEFDYTSTIYIYEKDLEEMVNRVNKGEEFEDVYYDVMAWYDDCDYYNCHLIEDKVRKEIERRLG
jgi:hypothetical protein